jgi:Glycosyltransferase family 87
MPAKLIAYSKTSLPALVVKTARIAWIGVLATFAIVGLLAARDLAYAFKLGEGIGWDLRALCAAFAALSEGMDPYYVVSEGGLSLPHAIVPGYPAKFLCPIHAAWPRAYVIIYLLLFVSSCAALAYFLLRNVVETVLVAIVSVCAFAAFRGLARTGNIVVLEVPFAVLSILAVHHRSFVIAGVALGLMSSLKMLPLVGVLAFLILPVGWGQKVGAVAASLLTFGAIQLINFMVSGPYGLSFLKMLVGQIPTSPYFETGGIYNPDFIDFVFHVFGKFGIQKATLIASAIGLFALAIGGWVTMLAQRMDEADRFATVRLFGLAYLICILFLFRLKPYAFATLVPFAIAAVMFPIRTLRYIGYSVLALMPIWSENIGLMRQFYQTISLIMFLVAVFGLEGCVLSDGATSSEARKTAASTSRS